MSKTTYQIAVESRGDLGKGVSRRAKKAGKIPAVMYSRGLESVPLFVNASEWEAVTKHDFNLITLVEGKKKTAAVVKEIQNNFLKSYVVHIDFQEVKMDEKIIAAIPVIAAHGEPVGVSKGGNLEQSVHEIEVSAFPADLPEHIEVNISALEIGDALHIGDIQMPENVEVVSDLKLVVFHVAKPIGEEKAETAEGTEEKAEAEKGK